MARKFQPSAGTASTARTILCIDDQTDFLEAISSLITRQGHRVLTASDGSAGLALLRSEPVDLLLLDYFMPGMTAEDVLAQVWNPNLQVILLTGYASEKPPREMLERLNIQGYCDKSRGPDELLLWVDVGLRASATVKALESSRTALRQILSTAIRPTERNPLQDVLAGLISQASSILGLRRAAIALVDGATMLVPPSSFEESVPGEPGLETLRIAACLGEPDRVGATFEQCLPQEALEVLREGDPADEEALGSGSLLCLRNEGILVGLMWIEPGPAAGSENHEFMTYLAAQAAAVIRRHESATLDLLTGLQTRGFWRQAAWRDLRTALRFQVPVSLTTIGLLRMDAIPAKAWDPVMEAVGRLVQLTIRGTDLAMRENDHQITILLPHTDVSGAQRFGQLLTSRIADLEIPYGDGVAQIEAVSGSATFAPITGASASHRAPAPAGYFDRAESLLRTRAASLLGVATLEGPGTSIVHDLSDWPIG
jgi:two-component system cell cycle response regulator